MWGCNDPQLRPPVAGAAKCSYRRRSLAVNGSARRSSIPGTEVSLTETPAKGFRFKGWSDDCSGKGACEVTLSADVESGCGIRSAAEVRADGRADGVGNNV